MATQLLSLGYIQTLTQNTIYALPSRRCLLFCDVAAPTFEQAADVAFGSPKAVTLTNGQAELAGGFLRCTSGNVNILIKASS